MFRDLFTITGFETAGTAVTIAFFVFFLGVVTWTLLLKKGYIDKMGGLPLDSHDINSPADKE
jgi:hypothetical protein